MLMKADLLMTAQERTAIQQEENVVMVVIIGALKEEPMLLEL
jgi:hypothetical protein